MKDASRSLFRDDAIRRYMQGKAKPILPRFVSPRIFLYLWSLLGLLGVSGLLIWFVKVPVYVSGSAVVVSLKKKTVNVKDNVIVVAFLPSDKLSNLRTSQQLFLQFNNRNQRLSSSIIAIEPEILSPDEARKKFALSNGAALIVNHPAAVAIARLEGLSTGLSTSKYVGSIGRVDVEVGSRQVISLLPFFN